MTYPGYVVTEIHEKRFKELNEKRNMSAFMTAVRTCGWRLCACVPVCACVPACACCVCLCVCVCLCGVVWRTRARAVVCSLLTSVIIPIRWRRAWSVAPGNNFLCPDQFDNLTLPLLSFSRFPSLVSQERAADLIATAGYNKDRKMILPAFPAVAIPYLTPHLPYWLVDRITRQKAEAAFVKDE